MQPYANYETDVGVSWHALRPREGVDKRVRVGALGLSIGMILTAALNVIYLLLVHSTGTGGFTHLELRQACEETWVPGFTMDAVIDGTAVVKDATAVKHVMKLGTCEQADGPLRAFSLSLLFLLMYSSSTNNHTLHRIHPHQAIDGTQITKTIIHHCSYHE